VASNGKHGYDKNGDDCDDKDRWSVKMSTPAAPKSAGISCSKYQTPSNKPPCTSQQVVPQVITPTYLLPCVIERMASTGHAYDDADPTTAPFAPVTSTVARTTCPPATPVTPLTGDATKLKAAVAAMLSGGKSAGHLGIAWGMYTVSPNWKNFWTAQAGSAAAPVASSSTNVKIVLFVTDGGFNWHYNADTTPVDEKAAATAAAASAANGTSASQANQICTYMKSQGMEVFTVGVDLGSDTATQANLQACASPATALFSQHYYNITNSAAATGGLVSTLNTIGTAIAISTGTGNQVLRFTQ
jgi:hypothetical protein